MTLQRGFYMCRQLGPSVRESEFGLAVTYSCQKVYNKVDIATLLVHLETPYWREQLSKSAFAEASTDRQVNVRLLICQR